MLSVVPSVPNPPSGPHIFSKQNTKQQVHLPGILGGLGPLAHIEFEKRLLHHSIHRGACRDQDHPDWVLLSAASTPDRTQWLLNKGTDCVPSLVHSARTLEMMGADFLVVTCNTAHAFYPVVQSHINIPWFHMMEATARHIANHYPQIRQVGLLATDGTVRSQLYTKSLSQYGLEVITPSVHSPTQKSIMQSIYAPDWGIKSNCTVVSDRALEELITAIHWLEHQGAELIIAGCTELSVGLRAMASQSIKTMKIEWVDPLDTMAKITVDVAYRKCLPSAIAV
ncbi:MAG: amino acid racemase [Cyanobacteria bacterium P01_F01_bin.150]